MNTVDNVNHMQFVQYMQILYADIKKLQNKPLCI